MLKRIPVISLFLLVQFSLFAQELQWKTGLNYFFDNTEFAQSTITKDQTMTGVHFTPEAGLSIDSVHGFYVGTDLLKISGSRYFVDIINPIAYYQYKTQKTVFYAGVFPKAELLSNYSDFFFQDSVRYFIPNLQGIFWQVGRKKDFFNLWLDWNGHQTATDRETFFVGASAYKSLSFMLLDFQSYMFHYANTRPRQNTNTLCDNLLAHLSLGVNYSNKQGLDTLLFAVGVLAGVERDRAEVNGTHTPVGAVLRFNTEYRRFGTQNTLYLGDPRMVFYSKYSTGLYYNNPFLRSRYYLESKWYMNVIHTQYVNGDVALKLHYSEGKLMTEQVFNVGIVLDKNSKPGKKSTFF
jgi:hypothetical protein